MKLPELPLLDFPRFMEETIQRASVAEIGQKLNEDGIHRVYQARIIFNTVTDMVAFKLKWS